MRTDYVVDREGRRRKLVPGEVARDGDTLRVSILAMDGASTGLRDAGGNAPGHRPGYVFSHFDASPERLAARDDYESTLAEAWRGAGASSFSAEGQDLRGDYEERLRSAWRGTR